MLVIVTGNTEVMWEKFHNQINPYDDKKSDLNIMHWMPYYSRPNSEQSRFGYDKCIAAQEQNIIIFTQSDHMLNGARIATAETPHLELCGIVYYEDETKNITRFNQNGNAEHWPKGFFDQIQKDLHLIVKKAWEKRNARR